jgi:hypothetical protein
MTANLKELNNLKHQICLLFPHTFVFLENISMEVEALEKLGL